MSDKHLNRESGSGNPVAKMISCAKQYFQGQPLYRRLDVQQTFKTYLQIAKGLTLQGLLLFLFTEAVFLLIVTFCKAFAGIYTSTYVGREMLKSNASVAMYVTDFVKIQPLAFTLEILAVTLIVGSGTGVLFRFFQLTESFYFSHGFIGRMVFFVPPIAGIVCLLTSADSGLHWHIVFTASLIPTLCFLNYCFILAHELLPEAGTLLRPWLRLSLAWEIFHKALLTFLVSIGVSLTTFLVFEWVVEESGGGGDYFPGFLGKVFEFLNAMSVLQNCLFVVMLCLALYLTGVLIGMLVQLLGLFKLFENLTIRKRLLLAVAALSMIFYPFSNGFIDLESNLAVFTIIVIPALCMAIGCIHVGHSLVVNILLFHRLEEKIQGWSKLMALTDFAGKLIQRSVKKNNQSSS